MSESVRTEFRRLAKALLRRDGDVGGLLGDDQYILAMKVDALWLSSNGDKLYATLPSNSITRTPVHNDFTEEYSHERMSKWIPRLRARLILEELANA